jgi:hypothetical protein
MTSKTERRKKIHGKEKKGGSISVIPHLHMSCPSVRGKGF